MTVKMAEEIPFSPSIVLEQSCFDQRVDRDCNIDTRMGEAGESAVINSAEPGFSLCPLFYNCLHAICKLYFQAHLEVKTQMGALCKLNNAHLQLSIKSLNNGIQEERVNETPDGRGYVPCGTFCAPHKLLAGAFVGSIGSVVLYHPQLKFAALLKPRMVLAIGDETLALAEGAEALALAEQIGDRQAICESLLLLGEASLRRGAYAECAEHLRKVAEQTTDAVADLAIMGAAQRVQGLLWLA